MSTPKEQSTDAGATPRTDALDCCYIKGKHARLVPSNFARELERELAAERAIKAELVAALDGVDPMFDNDGPLIAVYAKEIESLRAALARAKEANK